MRVAMEIEGKEAGLCLSLIFRRVFIPIARVPAAGR